jgi:hypothetical protein
MFDSMIEPILLYGSELWGYENLKVIEQIQLKFCKRILKVRNTTPNFMIYGELGRFPLEIRVKLRIIAFWSKLVLNENKLSSKHQFSFKWLNHIESIFNSTGMGFIFINQFPVYDKSVFNKILHETSLFKNGLAIYTCIPLLVDNFTLFSKRIFVLRTIYLDCRNNPEFGYHFLFVCKNENIITLRNKYLPNYYRVYPNHAKFEGLLSICNTELYKRLSICIRKAAALF